MSRKLEYINQSFISCNYAIDLSLPGEPIESLTVRNCAFNQCKRGINGWYRGPRVGSALIEDSTFTNISECAIKFANLFTQLTIRNCTFQHLSRTAIAVGSQEEPLANYCNAAVYDNQIAHVHGKSLAIGIWAYGTNHLIERNQIHDITVENTTSPGQDDDAVGIYLKTSSAICQDNFLHDAGGYEGFICCKGFGSDNRIRRNMFSLSKDPPSDRWNRAITIIENDNNEILDNIIDPRLRIVISPRTTGNCVSGNFIIDHHETPQGKVDALILWPQQ